MKIDTILIKLIDDYNQYIYAKNSYFGNQIEKIEQNDDLSLNHNLVVNLVECFRFPSTQLEEFDVFDELYVNNSEPSWLSFAEFLGRDLYYTTHKSKGSIFLVSTINNKIIHNCSETVGGFLQCLSIKLKLETIWFENSMNLDEAIRFDGYQKCLFLSGSNESNLFWKMFMNV